MKAKVYDLAGKQGSSIDLPKVFETEYKPVLIKRAVLAQQTAKLQPKGADPRAGLKNTARYVGTRDAPQGQRTINTDKARLPRLTNRGKLLSGRVARVSQAVGGRTAHAPISWKTIVEKINKKEKKTALESAIAATTDKKLVSERFVVEGELPIIIEDKFESTDKTSKVVDILSKIGLDKDLENAKSKRRTRSGKGKMRGRKIKQKKSILIVTGENSSVLKASRNLPGVDAVTINSLNVELLAPGAVAGRLTVWTKSAIDALKEDKKASKKEDHKKVKEGKKAVRKETKAKKKDVKVKKKTTRKKTTKKTKKETNEEKK
jgi:large subunit ribosomal protein L4e